MRKFPQTHLSIHASFSFNFFKQEIFLTFTYALRSVCCDFREAWCCEKKKKRKIHGELNAH